MPPKTKNPSCRVPKVSSDSVIEERQVENEKENKSPDFVQKRKRNMRNLCESSLQEIKLEEKQNELKPLGFWSKKLKDLEDNAKNQSKPYEFNGTDESESSYKRKKRPKQKPRTKRRQPALSKPSQLIGNIGKIPKLRTKNKKIHEKSLCREQIILRKERKKLADKGEKFTFSTGLSSLGITSTPAVNKDNLVGASNFLFLSPINKEEMECHKNFKNDENPSSVNLCQETPKMETKLKKISCRRVLRSGKMLNI